MSILLDQTVYFCFWQSSAWVHAFGVPRQGNRKPLNYDTGNSSLQYKDHHAGYTLDTLGS